MIGPVQGERPASLQQGSPNGGDRIEREIKKLQKELSKVLKDDKLSPEDKAKKVRELQEKIAKLEQERQLAKQKEEDKQLNEPHPRDGMNHLLDERV